MKIAIKILPRTKPLRLLFCFGGGILLALILSMFSYYRYWYDTIESVQTTKLKIISQTVPTKLSLLLANQQQQAIQQVLNSTDGYIGLVMTDCQKIEADCPQEKITYQTNIDRGWQRNFQKNNLNKYPYDILTSPPLLRSKNDNFEPTNDNKINQILGRVYYIRLSPSGFIEELKEWISNLLTLKLQRIFHPNTAFFTLTFLASFIAWKFIEKEVEKTESIAKLRHKKLELDLNELKNYNDKLILDKNQFNQEVTNLNQQIIELQAKTTNFKDQIKQKEEKLHQQEEKIFKTQNILNYYEQELARIKEIRLISKEEKQDLELKIKLQHKSLQEQESELKTYLEELQNTKQELTLNQYKEEEIIRLLRQREKEKTELEKILEQKENQLHLKEQQILKLEKQKEKYQSWREIAQELENDLQKSELLQEKVNLLEQEKIELNQAIENLKISNNQLQISLLEAQKQSGQIILTDDSISYEEINRKWDILCTEKFIDFWYELSKEGRIKTSIYLDYLQQKGVTLKYPYSSNIKGSSYRELIPISHADQAIRIFYKFTPSRFPILLCGGDKDGYNPEKWYKKYVAIAEDEYRNYIENREAFSFNELWCEMNMFDRQQAIKKFMKI